MIPGIFRSHIPGVRRRATARRLLSSRSVPVPASATEHKRTKVHAGQRIPALACPRTNQRLVFLVFSNQSVLFCPAGAKRFQSSPMRAEGRVPGSGTWRGLVGHRAQTRPGVGLRDNAPGRPPGAARRPAPAPGHMAAGSVTVSANPIIFATSRSFSLPGRPVSIFRGPAARVVEHRPIARLGFQPIFAFPDFSRRSDRRHCPRDLLARGEPWGVSNPHALARLRRNYS